MDTARFETCYQIALAIKDEVEDLEAAGIQVCIFSTHCSTVLVMKGHPSHFLVICRLSKLMRLLWEKACPCGNLSKHSTWSGLSIPSESPTVVSKTQPRWHPFLPQMFFFFIWSPLELWKKKNEGNLVSDLSQKNCSLGTLFFHTCNNVVYILLKPLLYSPDLVGWQDSTNRLCQVYHNWENFLNVLL